MYCGHVMVIYTKLQLSCCLKAWSFSLFVLQVVANAVAALSEIGDVSPTAAAMMEINSQTINKLLTALNECTE